MQGRLGLFFGVMVSVLSMGAMVSVSMMSVVQAQEWQPRGPMTMIVASSAGGGYDVIARAMEPHWEKHFGVRLIVQNVAGAGGSLGLDRIARARPDGQTIGFASRSSYMGELINKNFPWDVREIPILLAATTPPYVIVTGEKSEFRSWADVRNAQRAVRLGVATQITTELTVIKDLVDHGRDVVTASMGTRELMTSLFAGDLDLWIVVSSAQFMNPYREGDVRPLALMDLKNAPHITAVKGEVVPNMVDLGMPPEWTSIGAIRLWYAPIGTPQNIQASLDRRLRALIDDPAIRDWLRDNDWVSGLINGDEAREMQFGLLKIMRENDALLQQFSGRR